LSLSLPVGWKATVLNSKEASKKFAGPIAQGATVSASFTISSGPKTFNGDLVGKASWINSVNGEMVSETAVEKVRNVSPVKINEFRISDGTANNSNSFIEFYNAGNTDMDISGWTLTHHATQMAVFSSVKIPAGTRLAPSHFYLLGLSTSGLAVEAKKGETSIYVRSTNGMSVGDGIEIGTGLAKETRRIASITNPPVPETTASQNPFQRQPDPGTPTTIWQPLPEGPVITIPAGSTNIPITNVSGFQAGQKMAIGYGAKYPAIAHGTEKYEVVTITNVGKQGTQAYLSKDAKAGNRNIKVSSVANISAGDKIRLDIDSKGHGIETVTVTKVGTVSVRNTLPGPLRDNEDAGTGLDIAEPLKFDHASNIPFSARGTGISFEPATKFTHSSNEPVLPLGFIIKLDQPLVNNHDINDVVRDEKVTTAGYQDAKKPDQWFGGPALSSNAGVIVLRDATGNVVDGLNYGGVVDPWLAEGYQGLSGAGQSGCYVATPGIGGGFRQQGAQTLQPNRSAGRFPDGYDSDNNCGDFLLQNTTVVMLPSSAGSNNIKVSSVTGFSNGQKVVIGSGTNSETAVVAIVGTPGGTTVTVANEAGAKLLLVRSANGFSAGQSITIGSGSNFERTTITSIAAARRRFGGQGAGNTVPDTIMTFAPLKNTYAVGAQVSGSGITLAAPLNKTFDSGTPVGSHLPTPGEPNQYARKP
jgi:non-reducing end alpha-L-arabinofuranosidase